MRKLVLSLIIPLHICLLLLAGFVRLVQEEDLDSSVVKSELIRNFNQDGKKRRAHSLHLTAAKAMKQGLQLYVSAPPSFVPQNKKEFILGKDQRLKREAFGISLFRPPIFA